jgi:sigma-E factor negative regulatory protein RseA
MNEIQGERVSALLDGELDARTSQRTVGELIDGGGDDALARFGRYRLIGDVIRGESAVIATAVSARVREALRDEPVALAPPRRAATRWLRPLAGAAVAASVAAAAVVVAPRLMSGDEQAAAPVQVVQQLRQPAVQPALVAAGTSAPLAVRSGVTRSETQWQALSDNLADRLNRLVIEHHEFGGRTGINGPVPHIGFVSYDNR